MKFYGNMYISKANKFKATTTKKYTRIEYKKKKPELTNDKRFEIKSKKARKKKNDDTKRKTNLINDIIFSANQGMKK